MVMVSGSGPQSNVMIPPAATAATTALDVQLAGVPFPITRVGFVVFTARASAGTTALPFGLPGAKTAAAADGDGAEVALALGTADGIPLAPTQLGGGPAAGVAEPHPASARARASRTAEGAARAEVRTAGC
ncbi:hypothetical protein CS0771_21220 [Catellatospora sp. IY07-71]|nr:hypothetical protein CS0771_21220 [Catellatospora sp. IY07-71]